MSSATVALKWSEPQRRVLRLRERISVSAWAEKNRVVVRGPTQGRWNNQLTPYCVEPMDTIQLPWVRKVFLCWAPQTGKTSVGLNFMLWAIDQDPGPALYVMPDEKVAKRISRRQIIPTIRSTPATSALLSRRMDDVTSLHINFVNGMDIMLAWASSAAALASESIRYIFWDEPGKYGDFVGDEADPFSLGDVRTNAYPYTSKQIFYSTPNIKGDAFDRLIASDADDNRRYYARCPVCGHLQLMAFERIHWQGKRDHREILREKLARYTCEKCGMDWDDNMRNQAVRAGRWKSDKPVERPTAIAFGPLESWYSPFVSLSKVASNFLRGQEDPKKLQAFVTQDQARPWADRIENKSESSVLEHRTKLAPGIVPDWALALTAGFDSQKRGFWFVIRAWGEDLTSQLILYGNLNTFDDVEAMVYETEFKMENGSRTMGIWRAAIDTGGGEGSDSNELSRTEEIYEFLARMRMKHGARDVGGRGIYGVKGSSRRLFQRVTEEKDLDRKPDGVGRNVKYRAMVGLRLIDTFEMKCLIHWRMNERKDERQGPDGSALQADSQRFLLHSDAGMDYVRQLLAEELVKDRRGRREWRRMRADNHYLDAEVYAAACVENSWQPCFKLLIPATKEALKLEAEQAKSMVADVITPPKIITPAATPEWITRGAGGGSNSWITRR